MIETSGFTFVGTLAFAEEGLKMFLTLANRSSRTGVKQNSAGDMCAGGASSIDGWSFSQVQVDREWRQLTAHEQWEAEVPRTTMACFVNDFARVPEEDDNKYLVCIALGHYTFDRTNTAAGSSHEMNM